MYRELRTWRLIFGTKPNPSSKKREQLYSLPAHLYGSCPTFNWRLQMVDASDSMLAGLGNIVAPLFIPLGWELGKQLLQRSQALQQRKMS